MLSATPEPPSTNSDLGLNPPSFKKQYNNYIFNKMQGEDATPQKESYKIGGHKKSHQHEL